MSLEDPGVITCSISGAVIWASKAGIDVPCRPYMMLIWSGVPATARSSQSRQAPASSV